MFNCESGSKCKNKFSCKEDRKLKNLVAKFGTENWNCIAEKMRFRSVRQCRERWFNYLDPNVNNSAWLDKEDELLCKLHKEYGNKWKIIATYFEKRTEVNVKNRWSLLERHRIKKEKASVKEKDEKCPVGGEGCIAKTDIFSEFITLDYDDDLFSFDVNYF